MVGKVKPYEVKPAEADATDATDATDVEGGGGGAANDAHLQKNDDNQWYYAGQSCFGKLGDALSVAVFVRPLALLTGLLWGLPHPSKYLTVLSLFFTGLLIEPLAILQDVLYWYWLRQQTFPRNPVIIIGHWRSGTTYMHQLLACDPTMATTRNSQTIAPQISLICKTLLRWYVACIFQKFRPIDHVAWDGDDPQEDEYGICRNCLDTNMAGVVFCHDYVPHFRRCVTNTTRAFRRALVRYAQLTWLYDGAGKTQLLIKNSAHTARIQALMEIFPGARFVFLERRARDSVRSLVIVKEKLGVLLGLHRPISHLRGVEETAQCYKELIESFERDRHLIPPGQLVVVPFQEFMADTVGTLRRIYEELGIDSWEQAKGPIERRVQLARSSYSSMPIRLDADAEKRLCEITE